MGESKVAFVSGGASGIGKATAFELARRGYAVVVGDVDCEGARAAVEAMTSWGGRAHRLECDVTSDQAVCAAISETVRTFGSIDCAVNCAGIQGSLAPLRECTEENWARTIAVNLSGVYRCMREQLGAMIDQGSGAIVNVSSNMGLVGHEGMPAYCASKHGIIGLTKSAALDYARQGIRVNAVCPGPTDTPMVDKLIAASGMEILEMKRIVEANLPLQRLGRAEEIAAAIAWLGSDDASFITGAALSVDGGYVTR